MSATDLPDDFLGSSVTSDPEPQWSGEELEAAYVRALEALDAVESEIVATAEEVRPGALTDVPHESSPPPSIESVEPEESAPLLSPRQVLEACLFVGGVSLTAARLAGLLRGDYTATYVDETIEALNLQYQREARPYSIQLGEGGYRLALNEEFERLRHKIYGLGPREVRLSQDVLEILAVIAYQQPVTEERLHELERGPVNSPVRQLLRRDLIAVQRPEEDPKAIQYRTTPRFLSLFGLKSLDDLPRPEDLAFK